MSQRNNVVENRSCASSAIPRSADVGRKITIDNFDYYQEVHYMTEEHQNIDKHYLSMMATENRVAGHNLSNDPPLNGIHEMDNGKCVPSQADHRQQRSNYLILVERLLVKNIPYLEFLADVVTQHIPHKYSKEMSQKSDTVS